MIARSVCCLQLTDSSRRTSPAAKVHIGITFHDFAVPIHPIDDRARCRACHNIIGPMLAGSVGEYTQFRGLRLRDCCQNVRGRVSLIENEKHDGSMRRNILIYLVRYVDQIFTPAGLVHTPR